MATKKFVKGDVMKPISSETRQAFSQRLWAAAEAAGCRTQSDLARLLGRSQQLVCYWLHGGLPSLSQIPEIAERLGCDPAWLAWGRGTGPFVARARQLLSVLWLAALATLASPDRTHAVVGRHADHASACVSAVVDLRLIG
ncbi:MAG TPA: helix-turn-helix transcriptional regulator, partial [Gaiellaceae bacterium]|nr:helix-turn-helix transcriptional regulator [Gaiellaceae bacterium]